MANGTGPWFEPWLCGGFLTRGTLPALIAPRVRQQRQPQCCNIACRSNSNVATKLLKQLPAALMCVVY